MCRNNFIALVLAALCVHSANGSPARPATAHKAASAASAPHRSTKQTHSAPTHASQPHSSPSITRAQKPSSVRNRLARTRQHPATSARHSASLRASLRRASVSQSLKRPVSLTRIRAAMPPPLRGSFDSLQRQNDRSEADGLERILDDHDLQQRIAYGLLVPLPVSPNLAVSDNLPADRRYCRSWTATFLADLARAHAAVFHSPLEVSSAVRTVEFQKSLMQTNGNAAPAQGDIVSPHVTGATIDLAKQGLSRQQLGWLRLWLLPLQQAGKLDVEEEFHQACFHITVYKSYLSPSTLPNQAPASSKIAARAR